MSEKSTLLPPVSRRLKHATSRRLQSLRRGDREMPHYFIVGAKRAGTTSLDEYIVDHPLVLRGLVEKGCRYYDVNYHRGPAWFRGHLPLSADLDRMEAKLGARPVFGESSPYYCFHPEAAARIAADAPDARLIMVLRDPVQRAWSHVRYEITREFETLEPVAALEAEAERLAQPDETARWYAHRHFSYAARSRYAEQIVALRRHFGDGQLLVVQSEDVFDRPAQTLARVFDHLGLPPHVASDYRAHKALRSAAVPDDFRAALTERIADDTARLGDVLETPPTWA